MLAVGFLCSLGLTVYPVSTAGELTHTRVLATDTDLKEWQIWQLVPLILDPTVG